MQPLAARLSQQVAIKPIDSFSIGRNCDYVVIGYDSAP